MEEIVLQTQWGWQIAMYLFLGGLGAGTLFVSALVNLRLKDGLHRSVRFGAWAGTVCLIIGVLCLLSEVSMPARALVLWQSFSNFGSWMAIGAWLLFFSILVAGIYALSNTDALTKRLAWLAKPRKVLALILVPLSLGIAVYTGVLLSVLVAHPLWNTALLPALFTVSALDTGVALFLMFATLRENKKEPALEGVRKILEKTTIVLVAVEIVVLAAFLFVVSGGSDVGALSVSLLTNGMLAIPFWLLFVVLGLVVPLAISIMTLIRGKKSASKNTAANITFPTESTEDANPVQRAEGSAPANGEAVVDGAKGSSVVVGAVCCLIGGCTLRFLILLAGLPVWA